MLHAKRGSTHGITSGDARCRQSRMASSGLSMALSCVRNSLWSSPGGVDESGDGSCATGEMREGLAVTPDFRAPRWIGGHEGSTGRLLADAVNALHDGRGEHRTV